MKNDSALRATPKMEWTDSTGVAVRRSSDDVYFFGLMDVSRDGSRCIYFRPVIEKDGYIRWKKVEEPEIFSEYPAWEGFEWSVQRRWGF